MTCTEVRALYGRGAAVFECTGDVVEGGSPACSASTHVVSLVCPRLHVEWPCQALQNLSMIAPSHTSCLVWCSTNRPLSNEMCYIAVAQLTHRRQTNLDDNASTPKAKATAAQLEDGCCRTLTMATTRQMQNLLLHQPHTHSDSKWYHTAVLAQEHAVATSIAR